MSAKALRGYTLVELLVVTGISVLLMTVLAFIYSNALKVYNESQGLQDVYEASRLINRDLRDAFITVVPVPGSWITPQTKNFQKVGPATTATLDWRYLDTGLGVGPTNWTEYATSSKANLMTNNPAYDTFFSKGHRPQNSGDASFVWAGLGYFRSPYWENNDAETWKDCDAKCNGIWAWWMPGFFGKRDATVTNDLRSFDSTNADPALWNFSGIISGSWGWPRPDYRMDVDLDDLKAHSNMACWFYSEYKHFNSPSTLALDNANIVLVSIKLSQYMKSGREETQLSFMRHQIVGNDTASAGYLREDQSVGSMIRQIKITPYCLDGTGALKVMDDGDLGVSLDGNIVAGGLAVPRAFDIEYTLRNKATMQPYHFAVRIFCQTNPQ